MTLNNLPPVAARLVSDVPLEGVYHCLLVHNRLIIRGDVHFSTLNQFAKIHNYFNHLEKRCGNQKKHPITIFFASLLFGQRYSLFAFCKAFGIFGGHNRMSEFLFNHFAGTTSCFSSTFRNACTFCEPIRILLL